MCSPCCTCKNIVIVILIIIIVILLGCIYGETRIIDYLQNLIGENNTYIGDIKSYIEVVKDKTG